MKKLKLLLIIITLFTIITGCSSTKETGNKTDKIIGMSAVVGNEPFTHLALIVYPNKTYLVKGADKIRKTLYDNQGMYVQVKFDELKDSADVHIIQATDAKVLH